VSKGKPKRQNYDNERDWMVASLEWIERRWPDDRKARIDAWGRLDEKAQAVQARARLAELINSAELSPDEEAELDELAAAYRAERRRRLATETNERNTL
jgi:hypothetical protein